MRTRALFLKRRLELFLSQISGDHLYFEVAQKSEHVYFKSTYRPVTDRVREPNSTSTSLTVGGGGSGSSLTRSSISSAGGGGGGGGNSSGDGLLVIPKAALLLDPGLLGIGGGMLPDLAAPFALLLFKSVVDGRTGARGKGGGGLDESLPSS